MGGWIATYIKSAFEIDNLESTTIVWLDVEPNVSKTNAAVYDQFVSLTDCVHIFQEPKECEAYIRRTTYNRITVIVNVQLAKDILDCIHDLKQVISIHVYCINDAQKDIQGDLKFKKVKSLSALLPDIPEKIKAENKGRNRIKDPLSVSIAERTSSGIDGGFLHGQLLLDVLVHMNENETEKRELIDLCRNVYKDNPTELARVTEFDENYRPELAMWWYTRESFVYRMLNNAFRTANIDVIILFRFIIRDVENQLRAIQASSAIRVFRAQLMWEKELALLRHSVGELISINSFLSSTADRDYAMFLLESGASGNMERVLFEIDADPTLSSHQPFADISSYSSFPSEKEILFMAGSIFRLVHLSEVDGVHILRLVLCNQEEHDLKHLFEHIKTDIGQKDSLLALGKLLYKSGKKDAAKKQFGMFLKKISHKTGNIAYQNPQLLGATFDDLNAFDYAVEALKFTLKIVEKQPTISNESVTCSEHLFLGNTYRQEGDIDRALSSYEAAISSYRREYGEKNVEKNAEILLRMGCIYQSAMKHEKALLVFQERLLLSEKFLGANHPELAKCHNQIGQVYEELSQYDLALKHHQTALAIYNHTLPPEHPDIATCYHYMGIVLQRKRHFAQALCLYKQAAAIYLKSLPANHPEVVLIRKVIRLVQIERFFRSRCTSPVYFCFLLLITTLISVIIASVRVYLEERRAN